MSQTPELPDDGALEAVQFCLSIIRNNRTKPEDNAIWSCGTSSKPRITQKVLEACEAALAQSTQSPVEQPPQTVAGDDPAYVFCVNEKAALMKKIKVLEMANELHRHAVDRWVPCPDHRDKTKEAHCYVCENETLKRKLAALTRHEGA